MNLINRLKGSLNVITGCGSGLGLATVQWFMKQDCGLILGIDRHFDDDFEDKLRLTSQQREKLILKKHDTFDENVETSLSEFVSKNGTIDNVINVAGVAMSYMLYAKQTEQVYEKENMDNLMNFNTYGTFNMIRLASKYMIESNQSTKPKCIINTSCISTSSPSFGQNFYAGTKSSIDAMTLCIARELSPFNIRCNTIDLGYFDTPLTRYCGDQVLEYIERISLCPKRIGQPSEFAHLVQTIVENQMINGACIKLDGGIRNPYKW